MSQSKLSWTQNIKVNFQPFSTRLFSWIKPHSKSQHPLSSELMRSSEGAAGQTHPVIPVLPLTWDATLPSPGVLRERPAPLHCSLGLRCQRQTRTGVTLMRSQDYTQISLHTVLFIIIFTDRCKVIKPTLLNSFGLSDQSRAPRLFLDFEVLRARG